MSLTPLHLINTRLITCLSRSNTHEASRSSCLTSRPHKVYGIYAPRMAFGVAPRWKLCKARPRFTCVASHPGLYVCLGKQTVCNLLSILPLMQPRLKQTWTVCTARIVRIICYLLFFSVFHGSLPGTMQSFLLYTSINKQPGTVSAFCYRDVLLGGIHKMVNLAPLTSYTKQCRWLRVHFRVAYFSWGESRSADVPERTELWAGRFVLSCLHFRLERS